LSFEWFIRTGLDVPLSHALRPSKVIVWRITSGQEKDLDFEIDDRRVKMDYIEAG
jgi:hypothetical protein